jgi:hypothetical protein
VLKAQRTKSKERFTPKYRSLPKSANRVYRIEVKVSSFFGVKD